MNLFLTNVCNESCSFCYAESYFKAAPRADPRKLQALYGHLDAYAALVATAPPLPPWDDRQDELARSFYAARTVNLLGGEPTLHPHFVDVVNAVHARGLGVIVFTNGSMPKRIAEVRDKLWSITMNGLFAHRAPDLGFPLERVYANLPIRPGDDVVAALTPIRDAGIKGVFLAFATPAGGAQSGAFTPNDLDAMKQVHGAALDFCRKHGIFLGYDCSFPLCVDERVQQTRCSSVPVMDPDGNLTICGGDYFYEPGKRHISSFTSLDDLHGYTYGLLEGLRTLPSRFEVCNRCEHFNKDCHGMCLVYRERSDLTR